MQQEEGAPWEQLGRGQQQGAWDPCILGQLVGQAQAQAGFPWPEEGAAHPLDTCGRTQQQASTLVEVRVQPPSPCP